MNFILVKKKPNTGGRAARECGVDNYNGAGAMQEM